MLSAVGVSLRLGQREVLRSIDFQIAAGECVALVGNNGSGKTSLLRVLAGLIEPDAGYVEVSGKALRSESDRQAWRRKIGYVGEAVGLYETLNARENLRYFGALSGIAANALEARIANGAQRLELTSRLDGSVASLSKGLKLRVALLRALLHEPECLLLDEPSSGLDPSAQLFWFEFLQHELKLGRCVVLATHDQLEVTTLAHRVGRLGPQLHWLKAASSLSCEFADALTPEHARRLREGLGATRLRGHSACFACADSSSAILLLEQIKRAGLTPSAWRYGADWSAMYDPA